MKTTHTLPAIALAMFAAQAATPAQTTTKVVPAAAANTEGSSGNAYPFAYSAGRSQQIWRGTALTKAVGVLNGVSFRRDGRGAAYAKYDFTNLTASVGLTTVSPQGMSATYAKNITSKLTTVINAGKYSLPPNPVPTKLPAPFNIDLNWSTPLVFDARKANVIQEWFIPGTAHKRSPYFTDAERFNGSSSGSVSPFGSFGSFSGPELVKFTAVASTLRPGGSLNVSASSFSKQYQARLILGVSDKVYNGVNLPYDLAAIGAPKNSLYTSMDVLLPFSMTQVGSRWQARFVSPIPNSSALAGITAFAQSYYADAKANAAGLVASNGLKLQTPVSGSSPETNMVGHYDSTQTVGFFVFGSSVQGGPVARFKGILP